MTAEKKQTTSKTKKNAPAKQAKKVVVKKEAKASVEVEDKAPVKAESTKDMPPQSASKVISSLAGKMLNLTQIGAKKLEDYAAKSAEENDNNNARKLAAAMNRFSQKLENNQGQYIDDVEKNAEELINLGKQTFGSMKKVYKEMKTRAKTAKQKAEQDVEIVEEESDNK